MYPKLYLILAVGCLCSSLVATKTIGLKRPASDEELEKDEDLFMVSPEFVTEAMLASELLAQDYQESVNEKLAMALEASSIPEPEPTNKDQEKKDMEKDQMMKMMTPAGSPSSHHRSKRTIGFLARLGACAMTFMSNPSCWSRLTRGQINRAQQRDREEIDRERQRLLLQEQQLLLLASGNGTDGLNVTHLVTLPPKFSTPITQRPRFQLVRTLRNSLSTMFPRLFGFLRPHEEGEQQQPAFTSYSNNAGNSNSGGSGRMFHTSNFLMNRE